MGSFYFAQERQEGSFTEVNVPRTLSKVLCQQMSFSPFFVDQMHAHLEGQSFQSPFPAQVSAIVLVQSLPSCSVLWNSLRMPSSLRYPDVVHSSFRSSLASYMMGFSVSTPS